MTGSAAGEKFVSMKNYPTLKTGSFYEVQQIYTQPGLESFPAFSGVVALHSPVSSLFLPAAGHPRAGRVAAAHHNQNAAQRYEWNTVQPDHQCVGRTTTLHLDTTCG